MIHFDAQPISVEAAEGEEAPRTIAGIAVPWGKTATVSSGERVKFERGAFDLSAKPKLLEGHDMTQLRGIVTELRDSDAGLEFSARFANTRASNDAIALVKLGAYDSVSVGANPIKFSYDDNGTLVVHQAEIAEISLVAMPAFKDAVITEIAAQADPEGESPSEDTTEEETQVSENPEVVEANSPAPTIAAAQVVYAAPKSQKLPSAGEYIAKLRAGGAEWTQFNANLHAALQAATGDVLVSDAAGVVPTPIVGPVYQDIQGLRPITSALGVRTMPEAGATFIRPYVKVHSAAGQQQTELTALATADFEVDDIVVSKRTFGARLTLSEQVIDWSAPSMLDAAISDMAGQYALQTEKYVVDQMVDAVTNTQEVVITSFTDEEELIRDLYLAAASIAEQGNYLPNALVVGTNRWATLGGLTDSSGRPVFPQVGPMNAPGTMPGVTSFNGNPLGLQLVVSNQVGSQVVGDASGGGYTAKTANEYYWLLNTRGVEVYESYKGFLRDESVGTLGVTIALRGYFAAHVVDVNMIRMLGPNATFS